MLRRWLGIALVLAVAATMLAADAAQARERRMRGRRARNYDSGSSYSSESSPGYMVMGTYTDAGVRQSFYYAPDSTPPSTRNAPVLIDVRTPPDAQILFDGQKTTQTGMTRSFVSPPLKPGQNFSYEIKAKWTEDGKEFSRTRKVPVHSGEWLIVDLTRMAPGDAELR
jgi:uncharacterized protein (TIGR03000 family)